tara:strand:+ start:341 stop:1819 length:1479 start_codon:yes stop_codon:yes gene_type:complete
MSAFEKAWLMLKVERPLFPTTNKIPRNPEVGEWVDDKPSEDIQEELSAADRHGADRQQWELEHGDKKLNPRNNKWYKQQDRSNEPMGEGEDRSSERRPRGQETYHSGGSRVQTRGKMSAEDRASRDAQQKLRMHRAKIDAERNARVVATRQDEHQVAQGHHPGSMMNDEDIADPGYRPPRKQRDMYNPRDESATEYEYDADKRRYVDAQDLESIDDKPKTLQNKVKDSMEMGRPKGTIDSMVIKPGTPFGLTPKTEEWIAGVNEDDTHTDEETGRSKKIVGFGKTGEHWVDDTIEPKHPMQHAAEAGHLDDMEHELGVRDFFGEPRLQQGGTIDMSPEAKERLDEFMEEMNNAAQPARREWTSAEQKDDDGENGEWDSRGTFYGLPWNEETGFTTGEPMDIAYQLLKWDTPPPPCPHCQGTGEDPNEEGRPEIGIEPGECEPCDGTGKDMFSDEPVVIDERGMPIEDDTWRGSVETGEPMDIAYQLLKNQMI